MTKAKEIKGVVLCENFNEMFIDLIKKLEYPPELEKYLKYFESEDVTDLSVNLFNSDDFGKLALCDFEVFTSGFDSYSYHIHFNFDDDVRIIIIDRLNNYNILLDVSLQFNGFKWDYLFILPNSDKETTSEPEQPAEDAEEQDNPEQTPAEDAEELEDNQAYELTPLERIIFRERDTCIERYSLFLEKAEEAENDDEYDNCRFDASVAIRIADYLEYIIMEVGLTEKWYSWLAERKKQEAVGASK